MPCLVTALLRGYEHYATTFEINGRVYQRATARSKRRPGTAFGKGPPGSVRAGKISKIYARK
jgi:hypothetical protein